MSDKTWIRLMEFGKVLGCHQMPERSFFYKGYQFPVCARCTGVLISAVVAFVLFFIKKIPIKYCVSLSSVMLLDWSLQYLGIQESNNNRRFVTGLLGGLGWTTLHLYFYSFIFKKIRQLL